MSDENMTPRDTQSKAAEHAGLKIERERQLARKEKQRKIVSAIVSVIIALALWVYVVNQENPTVDRTFSNVKVELINEAELADNDLAIKTAEEQSVKVTVTGRRSTLVDLKSSDIVATADLSSCVSGENYLDVNIRTPSMVELKKISPAQVKVDIDTIVSSERDVSVSFKGDADQGYQPEATRQAYDKVSMTGAKQVLRNVTGINAKIDTSDLTTASKKFTAELIPVDKNGNKVDNVTLSKDEMSVWAQLYKIKNVKLNTSVTGTLADDLTLQGVKAPDTVKIAAEADIVDDISSVTAEPIDLSDVKKTSYVDLFINYPDGVVAADGFENMQAKVSISRISSRSITMSTDDISVEKLDGSKEIKFDSPEISIIISGPSSVISGISEDDIVMSLDASELDEGHQKTGITAKLRDGSEKEDVTINKAQVGVTVTAASAGDEDQESRETQDQNGEQQDTDQDSGLSAQ